MERLRLLQRGKHLESLGGIEAVPVQLRDQFLLPGKMMPTLVDVMLGQGQVL